MCRRMSRPGRVGCAARNTANRGGLQCPRCAERGPGQGAICKFNEFDGEASDVAAKKRDWWFRSVYAMLASKLPESWRLRAL